ncbi:MAG TPA: ASKHA domain-containing protein [Clostridia bacterium]|nr:ASKHA domain-containing protein [Clostridia bacterium]
MSCRVLFLPSEIEVCVPNGTLVSSAARTAGVFIDSPCGGNGTCGKCTILLSQDGKQERVLACQTAIDRDCTVSLEHASSLTTLQSGTERNIPFAPYQPEHTVVAGACFAAIDLGTTSIVCYLLDGKTGEQLATVGMQNPQSAFGADVIARANYVLTSNKPHALRTIVIRALNELIATAAAQARRTATQVARISIVGNTVMHHILLDLPLGRLVRAPYLPFSCEKRILPAAELGLAVHSAAWVFVAPVIGGFVGADTVACLSATAFEQNLEPALLLDIGTNGELVCTNGTRRVCCSTAAGPAFEGANISCGMRAESGAIDHVWLEDDCFRFSTIGDSPARGICGSGLIELIALLVKAGTINETGKFCSDASLSSHLFTDSDGKTFFLMAQDHLPITLSQKDVRELQLGKAAIRAGISVLLESLSLQESQITRVLLAGAFGSHLSPDALCDIGLLPEAFRGKVESIGNAAGEGAKLYVRNFELFQESEPLARGTEYIELSLSAAFTNYYIDAMSFPEAH